MRFWQRLLPGWKMRNRQNCYKFNFISTNLQVSQVQAVQKTWMNASLALIAALEWHIAQTWLALTHANADRAFTEMDSIAQVGFG